MSQDYPISFKRQKSSLLEIAWNSGYSAVVKLKSLRDECPCALCGDALSQKSKDMPEMLAVALGMYELTALEMIGNYAIKPKWKDGHQEGMYSWEILKDLCLRHGLSSDEYNAFDNSIIPDKN